MPAINRAEWAAPRIFIVEPHSDDAFLSMHTHITTLWKDKPKTIVTVFCDERRCEEANNYADSVGCQHIGLMLQEGGGLSHEAGRVPPFGEWDIRFRDNDMLVFPVGLQHPDHIAVRARLPLTAFGVTPYLFYPEIPYYGKLKVGEQLLTATKGLVVDSMIYSPQSKWKSIQFFKSQGRYWFYNKPENMPRLEITLRKS